ESSSGRDADGVIDTSHFPRRANGVAVQYIRELRSTGGCSSGAIAWQRRIDDQSPAVTITGRGKVRQRIATEQCNARSVRSIVHRQRTRRVVTRIADLGTRTCGDVNEVNHVANSELSGDL